MGKIVASYLIKAHLHAPEDADEEAIAEAIAKASETLNQDVKDAVVDGLLAVAPIGEDVTVSLLERTDD